MSSQDLPGRFTNGNSCCGQNNEYGYYYLSACGDSVEGETEDQQTETVGAVFLVLKVVQQIM